MRYIQLLQTTRFVVFQLANFFLFFFSGKYLISAWMTSIIHLQIRVKSVSGMLLKSVLSAHQVAGSEVNGYLPTKKEQLFRPCAKIDSKPKLYRSAR